MAQHLSLDSDVAPTEDEIVRGAFDFAQRSPRLYQLFAISGPKIDEFGTTPMSGTLVAAIEARLKHDMANGDIRQGDTLTMAEIQFAVVDSAYRTWSRDAQPKDQDRYISEAVHSMKAILAPG